MRTLGWLLGPVATAVAIAASSPATALPPRPAECDLSGEWVGSGTDDAGTRWTFPMHVAQTGASVSVTIEWAGSNGHTGTERARGTVDCGARTLELRTESVTGDDLAPGLYHAQLAPDHRSMSGRWDGPGVIPGRFSAARR